MRFPPAQNLLIDADDTLWENHAFFIGTIESFLGLLEERGHPRTLVSDTLTRIERFRTRTRGYGSRFFALSLMEAYETLEGSLPAATRDLLHDWGERIFNHPIQPFPGVKETLEELRERHRLILVTKGAQDEQRAKLARSGLEGCFHDVEILPEKNLGQYRAALTRLDLLTREARTWMVGNSPKSDINPAGAAGLRTVFIPHRTLWDLERAGLEKEPDLILRRFFELAHHF